MTFQTMFPDYGQIAMVQQETLGLLHNAGQTIHPSLHQVIHLLHRIPGVACGVNPSPDPKLRVYCTADANQHLTNIHLAIVTRYFQLWGNYDWYLPNSCHLIMEYFLFPAQEGPIWYPTWVANTAAIEDPNTSVAYSRIWLEAISEYLRSQRLL